jgi:hypothetical protein
VSSDQQLAHIADIQKKYTTILMKKAHVVGVSIGPVQENGTVTGDFALIVTVDDKANLDKQHSIPSKLEGVPVVIQPVGSLEAL